MKDKIEKHISFEVMNQISKAIPEKFEGSEKLKTLINDHVKHFKKDKWPISTDHILSDMFVDLTGVDPLVYFVKMLAKKGIYLGIGSKDLVGGVFYLDKKKPKAKKKTAKRKRK